MVRRPSLGGRLEPWPQVTASLRPASFETVGKCRPPQDEEIGLTYRPNKWQPLTGHPPPRSHGEEAVSRRPSRTMAASHGVAAAGILRDGRQEPPSSG